MYQPSKYAEHNTSLDRWMLKFNAAKPLDITAKAYEIEQFIHDGIIDLWGVTIRFDWTKRHQWQGQIFPFETVGQFERKFASEKQTDLAIMSNREETHTLGIWNSDFQERVNTQFTTDFKLKQDGSMRLSDKYKIYRNEELWILKTWLLNTYPLQLGRVKLGK